MLEGLTLSDSRCHQVNNWHQPSSLVWDDSFLFEFQTMQRYHIRLLFTSSYPSLQYIPSLPGEPVTDFSPCQNFSILYMVSVNNTETQLSGVTLLWPNHVQIVTCTFISTTLITIPQSLSSNWLTSGIRNACSISPQIYPPGFHYTVLCFKNP